MNETAVPDRVSGYVTAFNAAVGSGDWAGFATRLTADARLSFAGVPVGPFTGRAAIVEAYLAAPPTDTLVVEQVDSRPEQDTIAFHWSRGGPGVLRLRWAGQLVADVLVTFPSGPD